MQIKLFQKEYLGGEVRGDKGLILLCSTRAALCGVSESCSSSSALISVRRFPFKGKMIQILRGNILIQMGDCFCCLGRIISLLKNNQLLHYTLSILEPFSIKTEGMILNIFLLLFCLFLQGRMMLTCLRKFKAENTESPLVQVPQLQR